MSASQHAQMLLCHWRWQGRLCVLLTLVTLVNAVKAVSAACECIIFDNSNNKEYGTFTSPNWPIPYDDNIDCLLYTFVAQRGQIIEISFDEFDVQKTSFDCKVGDFVKLFLHLVEAAVNEKTTWNAVLCGSIQDIDPVHYSAGNSLMFEFHTDSRPGNNTGFKGSYRFLQKKMFETDGEALPWTPCDFQFLSINKTHPKGKFFSPNYPSTYLQNSKCAYHFMGKYNEKVKVIFEHVRLQPGDLSCLNSPDVIMVHDGRGPDSPVIGQLCNSNTFVELVSTGPDLYIEFITGKNAPGQGFKASYTFEEEAALIPNKALETPSMEPASSVQHKEGVESTVYPTNCDQWISSDSSKSGTFTSPNYPEPYPANVHCTYHFTGRGKERVQLLFTDFDLHMPQEDGIVRDCEAVDAVMVFITINGQKERVDNFCGNDLPYQLMSNGPSMTMEFRSLSSSPNVKGFRAIYKFITNFGITSGRQDSQSVCGFVFNSTEQSNGTFTSPNWPGYYPRDTECHYFFFGRNNERVHITFAYFDVEGVPPCTTDTASDYVEFSNYRTVDRKIPRHCGLKKPKILVSDNDFFRVAFKSNDKFDGTGFEAFFQFRNHVDPFSIQRVGTTILSSSSDSPMQATADFFLCTLLTCLVTIAL